MKKHVSNIKRKSYLVTISILSLIIFGVYTFKKQDAQTLLKKMFKQSGQIKLSLSDLGSQECCTILETLVQKSFEMRHLFLFDGAPSIGQCHLIAQKVASFYKSYQAGTFNPSLTDKTFLMLTFFTSNSFAQPDRLNHLKILFPEIAHNKMFLNFFNSEQFQEQASKEIASILVMYLQEQAAQTNDPLVREIQKVLRSSTSLIIPKLITVDLFLRSSESELNSIPILIKTKIMCSKGHHIALLSPSGPHDHYRLLKNSIAFTEGPVIMVEGFSLPYTIIPQLYEEIQKICPHSYKIIQDQKNHDLEKACLACTLCPEGKMCPTYKEVVKQLEKYTPRTLIMPIAADFVNLYEKPQRELLLKSTDYLHLKQIFIDQLKFGKEHGLTDTGPCTFTIRHVYPLLMTQIDQKKRYIDTRISTLLKSIIN